jgi:tetratricopeptide (TPR) repeat protein
MNRRDFLRALGASAAVLALPPCCFGELDESIADLAQAIRLDQTCATTYYGRGAVYDQKGNLRSAIADYAEAIRVDPTYGHGSTTCPFSMPQFQYSRGCRPSLPA